MRMGALAHRRTPAPSATPLRAPPSPTEYIVCSTPACPTTPDPRLTNMAPGRGSDMMMDVEEFIDVCWAEVQRFRHVTQSQSCSLQ